MITTINALPQDLTNKNEKKKKKAQVKCTTQYSLCIFFHFIIIRILTIIMTLDQLKKIPKLNIKFIFLIWKAYAYINSYYKNSELYKIRYSNITIWILFKNTKFYSEFLLKRGGGLVGRRMVKQGRGRGGGLLSFPINEL